MSSISFALNHQDRQRDKFLSRKFDEFRDVRDKNVDELIDDLASEGRSHNAF